MDYERLRDLLSAERLGSYLWASDGDLEKAFALYEWNIEASAAALSLSAMVEVVVRNSLDAQMRNWAASRQNSDWLRTAPLDGRGRADIMKAKDRAVKPPGVSGDFEPWEGWSHARRYAQAVPA